MHETPQNYKLLLQLFNHLRFPQNYHSMDDYNEQTGTRHRTDSFFIASNFKKVKFINVTCR